MSRFMQTLSCRFHPDADLVEDARAGDMICPECGLVVGDRMIDVSSEWRNFGDNSTEKFTGRVGAAQNFLFDHADLETTTTFTKGAAAHDDSSRQKFSKGLGQVSSTDKAVREAHNEIRHMASSIGLTKKVIDRAVLVYKTCYEHKYLHGRSKESIVSACIYWAARKEGSARTVKEICAISNIGAKEFSRVFSKMKRVLQDSSTLPAIGMNDIIPRFCNVLNIKDQNRIRKAALHVAERANELCNIQGRKPSSIASAVIYLTCKAAGESITKKDIKEATDSSEVVIREICNLMKPQFAKLFPSDFIFQCSLEQLSLI